MGVAHIIFIAINLAIPGWLYFRSSDSGDTPRIKWRAFEENLEKIAEASGGFGGCATGDVVQHIKHLCEKSMEKWTDKDSVIIERASSDLVFSCESRADATFVQWRIEPSQDADLPCTSSKQIESITYTPAFVFDRMGELHSIEFDARSGARESVKNANCLKKLELTLSRAPASLTQKMIDRMPRLKSDPPDYVTANRMCFDYHVAEGWQKLRGQVKR